MGQQPNIEPGLSAAPRTRLGPGAARSWRPDRPAELKAPVDAPSGGMFGVAGPDAGYALKLAGERDFKLQPGEHHHDMAAAVAAIACARAARVGRAPTADDVTVAMTILGLDSTGPIDDGLLEQRAGWVANVGHDAAKLGSMVADVPADVLEMSPAAVAEKIAAGWVFRGGADE